MAHQNMHHSTDQSGKQGALHADTQISQRVSFVSYKAFRGQTFRYGMDCATPYGPAFVIMRGPDIVFWGFCDAREAAQIRVDLDKKWQPAAWQEDSVGVGQVAARACHAPAALALSGTAFQHRVWQALLDIPHGQIVSYKNIADAVNSAPRAVGRAVGSNPVSLLVPCHRVLAADGSLNGYRWGLQIKARVLAAEGVALNS
tara:strand:- start:3126 stop:3728 length:603 start_codon:yes stop_codon:yes gene_type:complete